jgi:flagellar protein FlaJ
MDPLFDGKGGIVMTSGVGLWFRRNVVIKARDRGIDLYGAIILALSVLGAVISAILCLLFYRNLWADFTYLSLAFILGPYSLYLGIQHRRVSAIDSEFPNFLSDLAENRRAGLTIESSIKIASTGDYGEWTPELKDIYSKISWGVPVIEVLKEYISSTKSMLVKRGLALLEEAYRAGGGIYESLKNAADDSRNILWLKVEKKSEMIVYLLIVYIAFFVFLVIILLMSTTFIPAIAEIGTPELALEGSALPQVGAQQMGVQQFGVQGIDPDFYNNLFYAALLIQSIGSGIIGGIMYDSSVISGMKHAFVMCTVTYIFFKFLVMI